MRTLPEESISNALRHKDEKWPLNYQPVRILGVCLVRPFYQAADWRKPQGATVLITRYLGVPILAFIAFLLIWDAGAKSVQTSLGQLPGLPKSWRKPKPLCRTPGRKEKEVAFYERQEVRNAAKLAKTRMQKSAYGSTGRATHFDQIWTSLYTVFTGFLLASLVAIPVGIMCGLNQNVCRPQPDHSNLRRYHRWPGSPSSPWSSARCM